MTSTSVVKFNVEKYLDVLPNLMPMFEAHWKECGCAGGLEELAIDHKMYTGGEKRNLYFGITARLGGMLIGYASIFILTPPHHRNDRVAVGDCFYIHPGHRKGSLGLKLLKFAEEEATKRHCTHISLMSNTNTPVSPLLKRRGFTETETTYMKKIGE